MVRYHAMPSAIVVLGEMPYPAGKGVDWPLLPLDAFKGARLVVTPGATGTRELASDRLARLAAR